MNYDILKNLLKQAEEHINTGNFDEAETLVGVLLAELEKIGESTDTETARQRDTTHCEALITLSTAKWRRGDFETALDLARAALDLAEEKNLPDAAYAKAFGNIGIVYHYLSDYPQSLTYSQKALAINEEIGSKNGIASNLGNIGLVYQNLSDYPQALTYLQKALAIYEEIASKNGIARNLGNIGNVYLDLSDYTQALTYFQKALTIYEEIGSKDGIANNLCNIGNVYLHLSDYPQALTYYPKALVIYEEMGSKEGIAINLGNIGNVYQNLSDYTQALTYNQKALAIYAEIGSKVGIAINLSNIGLVYNNLSDYPQALTCFQKALAINEEIGSIVGVAYNLGNLGGLYANKEFDGYDTDKAEESFLSTIALSEDIGEKKNLYEFHKSLADLYETQERWKEHSIQFKKYHTLCLEVQSEEATKQAQQMEYRRKIEESERDRQVKLARFQEQEKILHNILPSTIADRMLDGEKTIADSHENVSVFFSDIVGFTTLSQRVSAQELVGMLNGIFTQFDHIAREHGLEKIKTIGDSYMAVCGAPIPVANHAERTALFALDVAEFMKNYQTDYGDKVSIRIGLHTGSVVAGIIGENKFAYDMWGDAVNTASRMESHGEAGKIHVSEEFKHAVETQNIASLQFIERGEIDIKGKGMMKTYYLQKTNL
ncbi:MAG: tetratricopeptide repeat protein [Ignavibacteria bacterium]|nr:tetratricopeptide repeat protein [Ignavibacteria bacterium]